MKNSIAILLLVFSLNCYSQSESIKIVKYDTIYETKTIRLIDTVYTKTDVMFKNDTLNETIVRSQYNELYEKLLDQKNSHYDSSLSFLEVLFAIISLIIVIVLTVSAYLGWNEFKSMEAYFKNLFKEEKESIDKRITDKVEELTRLKYEKDINELKESYNNLERFSQEASDSFSVKRGKDKPSLYTEVKTPKTNKNPFDKKK